MSNNRVVLDHGSFSTKYGYSGYNKPEGSIRSLVIEDGHINKNYITDVNESFSKSFNDMDIIYPIKNGTIVDFDAMELIWDDIFYEKLKLNPKITSILITEQTMANEKNRNKIKEIMFEKYNFNKIQFCNQQIVSLYGSGRSSGIVLDIGHDLTKCVPIYDSYIISQGYQISPLAGKKLNNYIREYMNLNEEDDWLDRYKQKYFKNSGNQLYKDYFFDININKLDCPPLSQLIENAINISDIDLRKNLAKNILITGGTSKISGLSKDIYNNLNKLNNLQYKIIAPKNRDQLSWLGASLLSCIPIFDDIWIKN